MLVQVSELALEHDSMIQLRRPCCCQRCSAAASAAGDTELAAFEAEIAAVEEEQEGVAGPATPEELEFEDDDGTWCVSRMACM